MTVALILLCSTIKARLLRYATSALVFSDFRVDPNLVAWNRYAKADGPLLCVARGERAEILAALDAFFQGSRPSACICRAPATLACKRLL